MADGGAPGGPAGATPAFPNPTPVRPIKSATAFRTIGEVATELGVAQHVLRYWEGKFPQLRPLQRAGNRRYYRPEDVALVRRIHRLLTGEGYTIRGVQQLLAQPEATTAAPVLATPEVNPLPRPIAADAMLPGLRAIRDALRRALAEDAAAMGSMPHPTA